MTTTDPEHLAGLALAEAERHPARSPGRRAASHLWAALVVSPLASPAAARRAVESFGDPAVQAAALELLHRLATQPPTERTPV